MATALRAPERPPAPQVAPPRAALGLLVAGLLVLMIVVAVLGALSGQQQPGACGGPSVALPAAGTDGRTLSGRVSWFGGPDDPSAGAVTASGKPTSAPGIAVYDTATLGGFWAVRLPNGHVAVLEQTDVGPAPWTGRVMDVTYSTLPALGYSEHAFPTDAQITARYLGKDPHLAAVAGASTSSDATACAGGGDGSGGAVGAAADGLAALHVPYNYGGGHVTPARPTAGQEGAYPGLDCSSSVSYVLQHAGLHLPTLDSTGFMSWGDPGPGRVVTIYANPTHVFMKIGGRYFGTSGFGHPHAGTGPAWFTQAPGAAYLATFVTRHPPGL